MYRYEKLAVWNECWQLYRGQEDWSDKEDWQSKIVLPKSFSFGQTSYQRNQTPAFRFEETVAV